MTRVQVAFRPRKPYEGFRNMMKSVEAKTDWISFELR